jgi:hypothetical protein
MQRFWDFCRLCLYNKINKSTENNNWLANSAQMLKHINYSFTPYIIYFVFLDNQYTVKPVYKGYSREPENVAFINSCPLYTG